MAIQASVQKLADLLEDLHGRVVVEIADLDVMLVCPEATLEDDAQEAADDGGQDKPREQRYQGVQVTLLLSGPKIDHPRRAVDVPAGIWPCGLSQGLSKSRALVGVAGSLHVEQLATEVMLFSPLGSMLSAGGAQDDGVTTGWGGYQSAAGGGEAFAGADDGPASSRIPFCKSLEQGG